MGPSSCDDESPIGVTIVFHFRLNSYALDGKLDMEIQPTWARTKLATTSVPKILIRLSTK